MEVIRLSGPKRHRLNRSAPLALSIQVNSGVRRAAVREARAAAPLFAALGDTTRLRIVRRLAAGDALSISSLTEGTGVTRQAVTKHLRVLDSVRLVRSSWRGRERVWELEPSQLEAARRALDAIAREWQDALGRLKSFVESQERRG